MSDLGNRGVFAKNLQYYMDLNGKTRNDVCNELGFKYTTLTGWLKAEKYPRIDKIEMLANYFHVQKSDLIERKEEKPVPDGKFLLVGSDRLVELTNSLRNLESSLLTQYTGKSHKCEELTGLSDLKEFMESGQLTHEVAILVDSIGNIIEMSQNPDLTEEERQKYAEMLNELKGTVEAFIKYIRENRK